MSPSDFILLGQLFIMGIATVIAHKTIQNNRSITKQAKTIELMLQNPEANELKESFDLLRNLADDGTEQFASRKNRNTTEALLIRKVLNYYENLAIGIKHNIYDERIIYDTKKSTIKSV